MYGFPISASPDDDEDEPDSSSGELVVFTTN